MVLNALLACAVWHRFFPAVSGFQSHLIAQQKQRILSCTRRQTKRWGGASNAEPEVNVPFLLDQMLNRSEGILSYKSLEADGATWSSGATVGDILSDVQLSVSNVTPIQKTLQTQNIKPTAEAGDENDAVVPKRLNTQPPLIGTLFRGVSDQLDQMYSSTQNPEAGVEAGPFIKEQMVELVAGLSARAQSSLLATRAAETSQNRLEEVRSTDRLSSIGLQEAAAKTMQTESFLEDISSRAMRVLALTDDDVSIWKEDGKPSKQSNEGSIGRLFNAVEQRVQSVLSRNNSAFLANENDYSSKSTQSTQQCSDSPRQPADVLDFTTNDVTKGYGKNPTVSMLALAHSLWSHVVRPNTDTVIDATAGNGGDSAVLAALLFPSASDVGSLNQANGAAAPPCYAQLVSIDVQSAACQNTTLKLKQLLPDATFRNHVNVLHTSHAPLPLPRNTTSVALVVYNLGFLPQAVESKHYTTLTETTIASIADAALLLRMGGMISVMTYPRTNREEALAVHAFLEGLALFSSDTISWETYILNLSPESYSLDLRERLLATLRYVFDEGGREQTWRVHEHKKLGWVDAPILLTATRIK
jgi:Putative rRNA methylase